MVKRIVVLCSEKQVLDELLASGEWRADRGGNALEPLLVEFEKTAGAVPLREVGQRAAHEAEREAIERVLHRTSWNRKQAARALNVSYKALLQKIRDCGIERNVQGGRVACGASRRGS